MQDQQFSKVIKLHSLSPEFFLTSFENVIRDFLTAILILKSPIFSTTNSDKFMKYPTFSNFNGFPLPGGFTREGFESGLEYEATKNDLFICTYPKSGTTWVQNIVYVLLHDGTQFPNEKSMTVEIPMIEEIGKLKAMELDCSPLYKRVLKTHLQFNMTSYNEKAKYICVCRNPKDVVVSYYYHTKGFPHYGFEDGKFDDYFEAFMQGQVPWRDYFTHYKSWQSQRGKSNLLFLTYEDLKTDIRTEIEKIARFIGVKYDENLINKTIEHSTMNAMKSDSKRFCNRPRDEKKHSPFIRKGIVGDWRSHMSSDQSYRIDESMQKILEELGQKCLWNENTMKAEHVL